MEQNVQFVNEDLLSIVIQKVCHSGTLECIKYVWLSILISCSHDCKYKAKIKKKLYLYLLN